MFTNRHDLAPSGELLPAPNSGHIYSTAFQQPIEEMAGFANIVLPTLSTADERKRHKDRLDVMNETLSDPRLTFGQKVGSFISGLPAPIVTLAPLTIAGGLIGGAVGGAAGAGLRLAPGLEALAEKELPSLFSEELAPYIPGITPKGAISSTAIAYGAYKGAVIPEHVVDAYNKDTDKVNWDKAIKEYSNDNWGFLLASAPFVAFGIGKKIYKGKKEVTAKKAAEVERVTIEKHAKDILDNIEAVNKNNDILRQAKSDVRNALKENKITQKEYDFFRSYLLNPDDTAKHNYRAAEIIKDMGSPFKEDSGKLWIDILDSNSIANVKKSLAEQMGSASKDGTMTNYIVNNSLDEFRAKLTKSPQLLSLFNDIIESSTKNIKKSAKQTEKVNKILDEHIFNDKTDLFDEKYLETQRKNYSEETIKNLKEFNKIESQKYIDKNYIQRRSNFLKLNPEIEEIYTHYTGNQLSEEGMFRKLSEIPKSNRSKAPYLVTSRVKEKLKIYDKLKKSNDLKEITQLNQSLKDIQLKSVNQELKELYNDLTSPNKKRVKSSTEYLRLKELASVRNDAKHVLEAVESFFQLEKQKTMIDLFSNMVKMADSSALKFADNAKAIQFYTKKLDELSPKLKERQPISDKKLEKLEITQKDISVLQKQELKQHEIDQIKKYDQNLFKDYEVFKKRVEQFEEKKDVFDELINCTLRGLNG